MSNDEDDIFSQEMAGVVPLARGHRVSLRSKIQSEADSSLSHRRQAAVAGKERDRNILTLDGIEPLDPWFVLEFKRPGVQNGVFRKLKQGRYEFESRLDLHRMTVAIARRELFDFIEESHQLGLRSALLIHGKGERERSAVLKGAVNLWLREMDIVLAFHSAQPRHGGTGAVYLLLRKSEEKKRENRERLSKGRAS